MDIDNNLRKSYRLSVPIMLSSLRYFDREDYLSELKRAGASRVFLALSVPADKDEFDRYIAELRENIPYFKSQGFEVGVWYWAFMRKHSSFTHITGFDGRASEDEICPLDPDFIEESSSVISAVASCSPDLIMFDDDYRFGFIDSGFGCSCPLHLKAIGERLGRPVELEGLYEKVFLGGANEYRDAWLSAMGDSLLSFADAIRRAVDGVNPDIRVGLCSCMSVWDTDGTDSYAIARRLAGRTKPFLRLIGAPYWARNRSWGSRLADIIELERMERSWYSSVEGAFDIEIFSEGDVYPRPRHFVPASYLEGFDTALRADGQLDGILKYMLDYTSSLLYERGYVDRHVRNSALYNEIFSSFGDKEAVGVRVYEAMNKLRDAELSESDISDRGFIQNMFFSPAARLLTACSIPTAYSDGELCGIAFGENAKHLPKGALECGLIIDSGAAEYLSRDGVDIGIDHLGSFISPAIEIFSDENERTQAGYRARELYVRDSTVVISRFDSGSVASYYYENAKKQRFLVYAADAYRAGERFNRSYARAAGLLKYIPLLSSKPLPSSVFGNPDLYMLAKRGKGSLSVGLWNFFEDDAYCPTVALDKVYKSVKFINCSGELSGDKIVLSSIPPYGFAAFELSE